MSLEVGYTVHDAGKAARISGNDPVSISEKGRTSRFFLRFFSKKYSLVIFVLVPGLIAAVYYFLIATGQYISETRMVVRTIGVSERFDTSEKRDGRSIVGGDSLTQDSYIVANYLESPQIVRKLETEIGLRSFFSKDGIDPLSRLSSNASFEDLHKFWMKQVDTYVDGPSGIIILTVRAFSAEDTVAISRAALAASEEMIDKISEKAKKDLVSRVEEGMVASLEEYRKALDRLREFQNKTGILDPVSSAKMANAIISKLTEEKLGLMVNLNALEAADADNTARGRQLRRSIQALDEQIQLRQNSLAGQKATEETQLSSSLTEFSRLETRRIVTQALYEASVRNLDTAKSTALKRTTFMSIFSDTHLPEQPEYPDRFSEWIILTAGLFTLWMTGTLIWMSIEDHRV